MSPETTNNDETVLSIKMTSRAIFPLDKFPEFAKPATKSGNRSLFARYRGPNSDLTSKWLKALKDRGYKKDLYLIHPDDATQWDQERKSQVA